MDTKIIKASNNELGTATATISAAEVATAHLSPVPAQAPGIFVMKPGTAEEEHIYYATRDAGAGTVSGLTRDITNLNGGVGREHVNGSPYETMQSAEYLNNIIDALQEGYMQEQGTVAYVSATSFTVTGDVTKYFHQGRILRSNGDNTKIAVVSSSSYSGGSGLTTVIISYGAIPNPLTKMEYDIQPRSASTAKWEEVKARILADNQATEYGVARQAIMNPGGQDISRVVAQRGTVVSGTCNNWANHLLYYGVDRWLAYTSDANGIQQAAFAGGYFGVYKANNAAANKLSQIQILEAADSYGLRGKKLSFGFIADKAGTTAKDITVFILAMKAAGTADSVTNAPISAFGADGVRPTFNTTNYDVLYAGDFTAAQMDGVTRLTGTTSVVVPADAKNIIFGVVNKQNNAAGDLYGGFKIKEVLLCAGDVALPFQCKSYEEEFLACRRFCRSITTIPGYEFIALGVGNVATQIAVTMPLDIPMRNTPALTTNGAANFLAADGVGAPIAGTAIALVGTSTKNMAYITLTVAAGITVYRPYWLIGSNAGGSILTLSADL